MAKKWSSNLLLEDQGREVLEVTVFLGVAEQANLTRDFTLQGKGSEYNSAEQVDN